MAKEINMEKIKQYTKEIKGVKYTAQFMGVRAAVQSKKQYTDAFTGRVDTEKLYDYIFDNVIVSPPGLDMDDFDSVSDADAVVAFGVEVLNGRFQPDDESGVKGRSKK